MDNTKGFILRVPKGAHSPTQEDLKLELKQGEYLFVLGANGTGKSSLMQSLYRQHAENARRISSHRQNWFESGILDMTAQARISFGNQFRIEDSSKESRWKEPYPHARANMAIFDLVEAENLRNRAISQAVDAKDLDRAVAVSRKASPLNALNQILHQSNLPIVLSLEANHRVVASRNGGAHYDFAELSDGERNALLIASNVLTVASGTLLVIDEPERHLHRSIISPPVSNPECKFLTGSSGGV